ncbi:MAG: Hpt domain-containing protein, partial [Planctomycetes bacterium]|nr:Hpt domain-containing protein [Planctomycetota bacterium]
MNELQEMLLSAFQVEHKEHLEGIRSILAEAEKGGGALSATDLDEAFRRAHSLKAAARVCDLSPVETLGQRLEALFSRVRQGSLPLDQEVIGVIHLVLNSVENWATCLADKSPPPDLTPA